MEKDLANLFKALSDEHRLKMLQLLATGETCGCTLIEKLPITQPTMSYHLRQLTDANVIISNKEGIWKKHQINIETIDEMIAFLTELKIGMECCRHE